MLCCDVLCGCCGVVLPQRAKSDDTAMISCWAPTLCSVYASCVCIFVSPSILLVLEQHDVCIVYLHCLLILFVRIIALVLRACVIR